MIYRPLSERRRERVIVRRSVGIGLALLIILGLTFGWSPPQQATGVLMRIASPFWAVQRTLQNGVQGIFANMRSKAALEAENSSLREALVTARLEAVERDALRDENKHLNELMGRHSAPAMLLGQIVSKPPTALYDTFILDVGSNDGVRVGDVVYVESIPIGNIDRVTGDMSRAVLWSAPQQHHDVVLASGITLVAEGQGGNTFQLHVPRGSAVAPGEHITLPGRPSDVIGIVGSVTDKPEDPFTTVLFKSPVNIYELNDVFIARQGTL